MRREEHKPGRGFQMTEEQLFHLCESNFQERIQQNSKEQSRGDLVELEEL